jgi:sugar phosphate isomerase/epimerase
LACIAVRIARHTSALAWLRSGARDGSLSMRYISCEFRDIGWTKFLLTSYHCGRMKMSQSRRTFLCDAAAVALGLATSPSLSALAQNGNVRDYSPAALPSLPKSPIKLGIASYTFRKFDSAQLMDFARQIRTPYLNLKDMHLPMGSADQVKAQADAYRQAGFKLTGAGNVSLNKNDEADMRSKFEYLKAAGIDTMICIPTHQTLPIVEKYAKQFRIKVAIHNHGPEEKEFHSPTEVLDAVKNMDPLMGLCVDVGHTMRAGTDPVEAVRLAGRRLYDIHMKDLAKHNDKDSQVAVGEGIMPVREIFQQLIKQKYQGMVDLEYEIKENDPLPGVMESFAYMRGVLRGFGYDTAE